MKFTLRPYQVKTLDLLRKEIIKGKKRPILCLPTGAGKTVTFSQLTEASLAKGTKVLVVCHRKELIVQAKQTMYNYGIDISKVKFGMVQTLVRSPHKIPEFDLCIIDECHIGNFRKFIELNPDKIYIGATATPVSSSPKKPLRKLFDVVINPVQIKELITLGYLSPPDYRIYTLDESKLERNSVGEFSESSQEEAFSGCFANIDDAYKHKTGKTIIFTPSVKMAQQVQESIPSSFIAHSKMTTEERDYNIKRFKDSKDGTIVNCSILTAGFDDPEIKTVILFRATTSLSLYLQMVGRGSRIANGKSSFLIIDLGNNMERFGKWEEDRNWYQYFQLQGLKTHDKKGVAMTKSCPQCDALLYTSIRVCTECGYEFPEKDKLEATEVVEIKYGEVPESLRKPIEQMTVKELIERQKIGSKSMNRPYKINWVVNQIKNRQNAVQLLNELAEIKGYKKSWIYRQLN